MKYSANGFKLTESFEHCPLSAYQDRGGVWTIAWGHTRGVGPFLTCIQDQADAWLIEDVSVAETAVNHQVAAPLTQDEFDALVDFVFNVGVAAFNRSTMLQFLNERNYSRAAAEFEKWDHVKAKVVAGLLRRREAEVRLFES